mmetsp:Transcript_15420/g.31092  ORF Transcript_15420/g.31092 Transcript_15420/m.31092 type:complete len:207 (+) Transcript_15420:67-687(+)
MLPLKLCARRGWSSLVAELLQAGAHVNAEIEDDETALCVALCEGHNETAKIIAAAGGLVRDRAGNADPDPILFCAERGLVSGLWTMIQINESKAGFPERCGHALISASAEGHDRVVAALLTAKANVDFRNPESEFALREAASRGRTDVVKRLLKANAASLSQALSAAKANDHDEVVKLIHAAMRDGGNGNAAASPMASENGGGGGD